MQVPPSPPDASVNCASTSTRACNANGYKPPPPGALAVNLQSSNSADVRCKHEQRKHHHQTHNLYATKNHGPPKPKPKKERPPNPKASKNQRPPKPKATRTKGYQIPKLPKTKGHQSQKLLEPKATKSPKLPKQRRPPKPKATRTKGYQIPKAPKAKATKAKDQQSQSHQGQRPKELSPKKNAAAQSYTPTTMRTYTKDIFAYLYRLRQSIVSAQFFP